MEVDDVKNYTEQNVLAMSAAPVSVGAEWVRPLAEHTAFVIGAEPRKQIDSKRIATSVRCAAPRVEVVREKSVHLSSKRVATLRNSLQLNDYGFGTPVGVGAPRTGVETGVPPRSRPV